MLRRLLRRLFSWRRARPSGRPLSAQERERLRQLYEESRIKRGELVRPSREPKNE